MIFFSLKISGKLFRNFLENFGKCFLEILGIKNSSLGIKLGDQLGLGRVKVQKKFNSKKKNQKNSIQK